VDDEFEQAHFVRLDRPVIGAIICKNRGNAKAARSQLEPDAIALAHGADE